MSVSSQKKVLVISQYCSLSIISRNHDTPCFKGRPIIIFSTFSAPRDFQVKLLDQGLAVALFSHENNGNLVKFDFVLEKQCLRGIIDDRSLLCSLYLLGSCLQEIISYQA